MSDKTHIEWTDATCPLQAKNARLRVLVDEYRGECVSQTFENARLREQADALATALSLALFYARGSTAKYVLNQLARAEAVLRTYREAKG